MSGTKAQGSEVARLLQQIRQEYESAQLGLTGLAYGTSQHKIITEKMEHISQWHEELQALVGDAAMELVAQQLSDFPGPHSSLVQ
jgi:hypothetical protein